MVEGSEFRWRKTDESIVLVHYPRHRDEFLFYARIYTVGQGYQFSQTNQLILNLKMSPQEAPQRLHYKRQAIQRCAGEVKELLRKQLSPTRPLVLVPMPPSKAKGDAGYDDRMEQVSELIATELQTVTWLPLLCTTRSVESYHTRTNVRNPEDMYRLMQVDTNQLQIAQGINANSIIAVLDDVLTSGAHFAAARRLLLEVMPPGTIIIGIFWAKAIAPEDFLSG